MNLFLICVLSEYSITFWKHSMLTWDPLLKGKIADAKKLGSYKDQTLLNEISVYETSINAH